MAESVYECMFILDSNKYARDPGGVAESVNAMIENVDGKIHASRLWAEQKLAYPINNHRKGTYWLTYFSFPGSRAEEFNRACQLNENVLRHLNLVVDPRLADTLIAHATGTAVADDETADADDDAPASEESAETKEPVAVGDASGESSE